MLEKIPSALGRVLRGARAGTAELMFNDPWLAGVPATIVVHSSAIEDEGQLPPRFTADGIGESPPLQWEHVPPDSESVLLLIEDADSPTRTPMVHAIAWGLAPRGGGLPEGALGSSKSEPQFRAMGKNSYFSAKYLPPDPPSGHGPHRYAFQIFALDASPMLHKPGRGKVLDVLKEYAIGKGMLIGTYERT